MFTVRALKSVNYLMIFQRKQLTTIAKTSEKISAFVQDKFVVVDVKPTKASGKTTWKDTHDDMIKYPLVWLRDNCQCSQCFHNGSSSRVLDWCNFDVNVTPVKVEFNDSTAELRIRWSDDHSSVHSLDWLIRRQFTGKARQTYLRTTFRPERKVWRKEDFGDTCQSFKFEDLINTNEGLRCWLHTLSVNGVALIEDTPLEETACRRLANRVGFIRRTHYGEEFIVRNKEDTSNVAYLSTPLQMHTDLPYYEYKPGVNLLHCLVQTRSPGAFNLLTDGLWVVEQIRERFPQEFDILAQTLVDWVDVGDEDGNPFHSLYRAPVICLDRDGNVHRINHSIPQRDSHFNVPLDQVDPWYRALATFVKILHEGAVQFKTKPGEILTFDNTRLIHGRTGYTDLEGNTRHLVGAYLDWDEIFSRLRVLSTTAVNDSPVESITQFK